MSRVSFSILDNTGVIQNFVKTIDDSGKELNLCIEDYFKKNKVIDKNGFERKILKINKYYVSFDSTNFNYTCTVEVEPKPVDKSDYTVQSGRLLEVTAILASGLIKNVYFKLTENDIKLLINSAKLIIREVDNDILKNTNSSNDSVTNN
jgi:hypothetical protein